MSNETTLSETLREAAEHLSPRPTHAAACRRAAEIIDGYTLADHPPVDGDTVLILTTDRDFALADAVVDTHRGVVEFDLPRVRLSAAEVLRWWPLPSLPAAASAAREEKA